MATFLFLGVSISVLLSDLLLAHSDPENRITRLVVPARISCSEKSAYVDFAVMRCVSINRLERRMPHFAPCPEGTELEGRHCVGFLTTDPESSCPRNFLLNDDGICIRGEAYKPPNLVCPNEYKLIVSGKRIGSLFLLRFFSKLLCLLLLFEPALASRRRANVCQTVIRFSQL